MTTTHAKGNMTTTHALRYNGAPYNADGTLVNEATNVTRGPGHAACTCGALSPESLPNGVARREWFKAHKNAPAEAPAETPAEVEAPAEFEAPAEAPVEAEAPAEPAFSRVLPFTKDAPASFWRFLGRDAVRRLADSGVLGPVTVSTNASNHSILVNGPTEDDVDQAVKRITTFWTEALEEVKVWKKEDATYLARPTQGLEGRKAAYELTGAFYLCYAEEFISDLS